MVTASLLLPADICDPIVPRSRPGSCNDSCPMAPLRVHDDGHVALIVQPYELAPIVTDFLLS
jgi:hypothetical protein